MKSGLLKTRKFWIKSTTALFLISTILVTVLISTIYWKQDKVVQELITKFNNDFKAHVEIKESHISPFENFPFISIDLEELTLYENETNENIHILTINDVYIGFNIWDILSGNIEIKSILLSNGSINIVQHKDGSFNITKALTAKKEIENAKEEFHLNLKSINLKNIDINKLNESSGMYFDLLINEAKSNFKTINDDVQMFLDSKFIATYIDNGDTTFIHNKHLSVHTEIDYVAKEEVLKIIPSQITLEGSVFNIQGTIDFANDMFLDIIFKGEKENFDLLIAFAPPKIMSTLKQYNNKGKVFFNGAILGKSINGYTPKVDAIFGCTEAFVENSSNHKKLNNLQFKGHFSNGNKRAPSSMEFSITDFSVQPEAGNFKADLNVTNFVKPNINLKLISDFKLDFLAKFLNLNKLENLSGDVQLTMNFHDIIDLNKPQNCIEKLNESYFSELKVTDLSFKTPDFHLPLKDLDFYAIVDGHEMRVEYFDALLGNSDLHINGLVNDLPAILHHTDKDVLTQLEISSNYLDLLELSSPTNDTIKGINEFISNMSLGLSFKAKAKSITESNNLPIGKFFINNFHAQLKHYPHNFTNFQANILIEEDDLKLINFSGAIDQSDFHFNGELTHYDMWLKDHPKGNAKVKFNLNSRMLQFDDLLSYKGKNFVPKDYRHEELDELKIKGFANLNFNDKLHSTDVTFDVFDAKMKIHNLRAKNFRGGLHFENSELLVKNFKGTLGKSDFLINAGLNFGADTLLKNRDNFINLKSNKLDFDQLFIYKRPDSLYAASPKEHEKGFNIYNDPFPNLKVDLEIKDLNYHLYKIENFEGSFRIQANHYIYIDTLSLNAAGGNIKMNGYFNGSNPNLIYFSPKLKISDIDLDKLLVKFENFGQDYLVSENLHGKISGDLWGKIHIHKDLVPIIDDSEIHLDFKVVSGKLENFGPMEDLAEYFADKNVAKIIFDTLQNHIDIKRGVLSIPKMIISTSLGFVEVSGIQQRDFSYEYYLRVPWKMVTKAGASKLFRKKKDEVVKPNEEDEIIYLKEGENIRYVNIQIKGNQKGYKIKLKKQK